MKILVIAAAASITSLGALAVDAGGGRPPFVPGTGTAHTAVVVSSPVPASASRVVLSEPLFESSSLVLLGIGLVGAANVLRSAYSKRSKRDAAAGGIPTNAVIPVIPEPRPAA